MRRNHAKVGIIITAAVTAIVYAGLVCPPTVSAQLSADEQKCRVTIAKSYAKYVKLAQKAIVGCHAQRAAGSLPGATDCNDLAQADTKSKASAAAAKAAAAVADKCAATPSVIAEFTRCPTPHDTLDDGGATTGIDDVAELTACLEAHAKTLTEGLAARVLGSPTLPLTPELATCHGALAKSYTKYLDTIVKVRAKCQTSRDKAGDPIGFDACVVDDSAGKIQKIRDKSAAKILAACAPAEAAFSLSRANAALPRSIGSLDSCADTSAGLVDCALNNAATTTGGGAAAMMWELPGICPGSGAYRAAPIGLGTELDVGWSGWAHDRDPVVGYRAAQFTISCDPDCNSCVSTGVTPSPDACRCNGDASVHCATPGADPACTGIGSCECYYGPPTPYTAASSPACVVARVDGTMTGSLDPVTGAVSLTVPLSQRIHLGYSLDAPCPLCVAGACHGGARDGLACSVDASDATYGDVSYDCPPSPGSNISGAGLKTLVDYTTGSASMPFGTTCDAPFGSFACACGVCSLDGSRVCNSNADCAAASAGTCGGGFSSSRRPNSCDDGNCVSVGAGEGECATNLDTFCDGFVSSSGKGIIACLDDSDCASFGPTCPGGDCGSCTLLQARECFLDPIAATGNPGAVIVGIGCVGQTFNNAVNAVLGLPGAFRIKQNLDASEVLCSDGVTEFFPPGGSNCP